MPMQPMVYEKARVLDRLKANKEGHGTKVAEAQQKYHDLVVAELEHRLAQAKEGKSVDPSFLSRFPIPEDYTREYERVIDQLESAKDSEVTLTSEEFNRYMRDEWEWHNRFAASTMSYLRS